MESPFTSYDLWAGLIGGLALFLFGMDIMTRALKQASGDQIKQMLGKLTCNRFVAAGTGAVVTSIIQSSSVTTVLLVGFISAGLMSLAQSVAVIIGANIGTTITAQILAFNVSAIALPVVAAGFTLSFASKQERVRHVGFMLLGLGLVFYGMGVMSEAMKPLRDYPPFIEFMLTLRNPFLAMLVGAGFTALVQSSSATTGILIVLAGQGVISLEAAIAIALGANIGTCITAGLASIGKPREAVRAALVHTLFNVLGVVLWLGFIPQLAEIARMISPVQEHMQGVARLAAETPRQIANVHSFFNIVNAFVFIGFTTQIARLVEWLVPDRPPTAKERLLPKYLDESALPTTTIALDNARLEIGRIGKRVSAMFEQCMPMAISGSQAQLLELTKQDKAVDALHRATLGYIVRISANSLTEAQTKQMMSLIKIANDLERIGDLVATDLAISATKRINKDIRVSDKTGRVLMRFHKEISCALNMALEALASEDEELAKKVRAMKHNLREMANHIAAHEVERLSADGPARLATYAREIEVVEILDSIFKITRRIARAQLDGWTRDMDEAENEDPKVLTLRLKDGHRTP